MCACACVCVCVCVCAHSDMCDVQDIRNGTQIGRCTGHFVAADWVMTAGHCWPRIPYKYAIVHVVYGCVDIADTACKFTVSTYLFRHPCRVSFGYTESGIDVMMLRVVPSAWTASLMPLPFASIHSLFERNASLATVVELWGVGFGNINDVQNSRFLLAAQLELIEQPISGIILSQHSFYFHTPLLLRSHTRNQSMCSGDSGGPLVALFPNGTMYSVGLFTAGRGNCSFTDEFAYFAYVGHSAYIQWITDVMQGVYDLSCHSYSRLPTAIS